MEDTTKTVMRSAKSFFSGTMVSRFTGMLRDVAMAFAFGTQDTLAAFLVAFRLAHLLRRLFGEGALQTAFIPQFERLRTESPKKACHFFIDLYAALSLFLTVLIFVAMICCSLLLWKGNLNSGNAEIAFLSLIMLPSLLFICLFGLNASLLQCEKSYFIPSVAPAAFNLIWIAAVLWLKGMPATDAMPWLSVFIIIASFCQWLMTLPKVIAILKSYDITNRWKNITFFNPEIRRLVSILFLGILGVGASQINNALDSIFARYANLEGPAYLWYAIRLQQLPLALFGIALSGALLPALSRAWKADDKTRFSNLLQFSFEKAILFMLPMTLGIFLLGSSSINLIYGHGDFSKESIIGTTQCLWGYGLGLLPMTLVLILAPVFYAKENYRIPAIASVASVLINIILNFWFVMGLGWGSASVAIATSLSAFVNLAILIVAMDKSLKTDLFQSMQKHFPKVAVATLMSSLALCSVEFFWTGECQAWLVLADSEQVIFPSSLFIQGIHFFGLFFIFSAFFVTSCASSFKPIIGRD